MNLIRGVALIGMAGACCGADPTPDPVNTLTQKSAVRVTAIDPGLAPYSVTTPITLSPYAMPRVQPPQPLQDKVGVIPIPTQFSTNPELIPTNWPEAKFFLCNKYRNGY